MSLQFPNARLLIHNLLADEQLSGAEAIARGACEYGIITACDLDSLEDSDMRLAIVNCDCCEAAHCVLRRYFKSRQVASSDMEEAAWNSMMRRLSKYTAVDSKTISKNSEPDCQTACSKLAPVVFDLLLQEVRRYA